MRVRAVKLDTGNFECECGRKPLRVHKDSKGRRTLQSHLPPGENDPHKFCVYSHAELDDGDIGPLLISSGTRVPDDDSEAWGWSREVNGDVEAGGRVPLGVLGYAPRETFIRRSYSATTDQKVSEWFTVTRRDVQ
jgi:hypothetical protein